MGPARVQVSSQRSQTQPWVSAAQPHCQAHGQGHGKPGGDSVALLVVNGFGELPHLCQHLKEAPALWPAAGDTCTRSAVDREGGRARGVDTMTHYGVAVASGYWALKATSWLCWTGPATLRLFKLVFGMLDSDSSLLTTQLKEYVTVCTKKDTSN